MPTINEEVMKMFDEAYAKTDTVQAQRIAQKRAREEKIQSRQQESVNNALEDAVKNGSASAYQLITYGFRQNEDDK